MSKTLIELYNSDKYQPVVQDGIFDKVQGQSNELILSGDGRETSASGNTAGSITLNVSGGMWTDHGQFNTQQFGVSGSLSSGSAQTVFQFDSSIYNSCFVELLYGRGGARWAECMILVVDGSGSTFERTTAGNAPHSWSATTVADTTDVKLTGQTNDTYKLVAKLL